MHSVFVSDIVMPAKNNVCDIRYLLTPSHIVFRK